MPTNYDATFIPWAGGVPYGKEANDINSFMAGQALSQYARNLPGYANAVGQRSENTQQMLEGKLPQDVVNQIAQQSAERGIGSGGSGGPNANAAYLRALGLNSLQMQEAGSQQLTQSIADTPVAELWNPTSLWMPTVLGQQEKQAANSKLPSSSPTWNSNYNYSYSTAPGGFGATMALPWHYGGY